MEYIKVSVHDIRAFCAECCGAKKLVERHCNNKKCVLYKYRTQIINRTKQLTLFTLDGFLEFTEYFLKVNYRNMLRRMWWSDIRSLIEKNLRENGILAPHKNWWGVLAARMPTLGWRMNNLRYRTSPINNTREYLYCKIR